MTQDPKAGDGFPPMSILTTAAGPSEPAAEYLPFRLQTGRGDVECRSYPAPGARHAALWVGGIGGHFDSPARGLYPQLCRELQNHAVASLRVRFRYPTDLAESVQDVLAGLAFVRSEGAEEVLLAGHSFGGAVVIQAAAASPLVRTVVALATQSYGTEPAARLGPHCSLLLIHGTADRVLPPLCSEVVYRQAREPKRLVLHDGAGHNLDESADEVRRAILGWVGEHLTAELV